MWEYLHQIGIVKNPENYKSTAGSIFRLQQYSLTYNMNATKMETAVDNIAKK